MSRSASASHHPRPRMACWRQGPGSPAASARIQPVLRRSPPSSPSRNKPAEAATRSWVNNGAIRALTARSDDAQSSSVVSIEIPVIHDLRIMVTDGFRRSKKAQLRYVYFWADGIHLEARLEDQAQCILVIIGATPEGKKELIGFTDGMRESAQSWRDLQISLQIC